MRNPALVLVAVASLAACHRTPPPPPASPDAPTVSVASSDAAHGHRAPPVATPERPVADTYYGVTVTDPYRWLESGDSDESRAWSAAQNRHTREVLDPSPHRAEIEAQLTQILSARATTFDSAQFRGGTLFVMHTHPNVQQPYLVAMRSPDDATSERVVVDPNTIDASGQTAIDWFVPSRDGRKLAVVLARNGSEVGTMHFFDATNGHEIGDTIDRVSAPTGGGSAAWNADASGSYYTRYPRAGERPEGDLDFYQQVYFHTLGHPDSEDRYEIGRDFPRIAEIALHASPDGRWTLAQVANGDGGEFAHYLRGADGHWTQLTQFADRVTDSEFGEDAAIYFLSHQGAPHGKVLRMPLATPALASATVIVPEGEAVVQQIVPTASRLYTVDLVGGPSQVRVFDLANHAQTPLSVPPIAAVRAMIHTTGDEVLYRVETYLVPPAWYRSSPALAQPALTAMRNDAPVNFDDAEVVREVATSRDGTHVPVMVIRRRGTNLDGNNPTLLGGYGGYGVSMVPRFDPSNRVWLDRGGVVATAILRGGGEFGEEWHHAGNLVNKQHVFDDFIAAAEMLVERHYTTSARLAIRGRSNGGLLMGAVLTQRPELFHAVYSGVGIYDMLRVELDPNGAFNVTEFGTVRDESQFRALYAYSPYHHVRDGAMYPAILMTTGAHDGRVNPSHSRKMIARLQAATGSDAPILLRTSDRSGHGMGSSRTVPNSVTLNAPFGSSSTRSMS
jgi:prolyl oligopeptidase